MTAAGSDPPREIDYRPKWWIIVACGLMFGGCALLFANLAARNHRGLIINGIIRLGPQGATVFYWSLFGASAAFVLMSLFLVYHRLRYRQRLVLGPSTITVPASRWSRRTEEIAYADIRDLVTTEVSGQRFLQVVHPGGKYTIVASMLPSRAVFEELGALLEARRRNGRELGARGARG
jgi:hypothetical protein